MTDQEKIRELSQYGWLRKEEQALRDELNQLRLQAVPGAIRYDGSGIRGPDSDRMAEWVARIEKTERKLSKAIERCNAQRRTIEAGIGMIRDSRERIIIRRRYVNGEKFEDIADSIGYTRQYVYVLHRRGIKHYRSRRQQ